MALIIGRYVKFNVGGVPVTEDLQKALQVLDGECRYGSGGSWDIVKSGKTFKAIPCDGPFDSVKFNQKKNRWEEC